VIGRLVQSSVVAIGLVVLAVVAAWAADPKLPAGQDPGGVAVAVIGDGLDYRKPEFAARFARDGEGELTGWDFVDEDRRPFGPAGRLDAAASIVIAESAARLVPVRVAPGVERHVAQALRLLSETPSQVALLVADADKPIARANLLMAARQLPRMLIVVPAGLVEAQPRAGPGTDDPAGLLVVSGSVSASGPVSERHADLIVDVTPDPAAGAAPASGSAPLDDLAAAKVAALAARLIAKDAALGASDVRARLLAFAETKSGGTQVLTGIERLAR